MDTDDRLETAKIENIDIRILKDYFLDMDCLKDFCDDLINCYKKEQDCYLEDDKFNKVLEEEAELVESICDVASDIKSNYKDVLDAFKIRATERERRRRVEISKELSKKPRAPKDN
ncbi:hypothetical protein KM1_334120 [Entamoeba histolytica HM-3:IMSS]|uniref:Uncharacterized protein n=4 Tax=Entamoeba histolytica TaxID=5759 RepID=C4M9P8_ENTH1|nr:hypothetical protein EHI_095450 [Entamoeba histolytica HM-1:IMSS]EAL43836.1 hypothetical protein EHI_095450 [Entamoeba histolytica HM-1:IMSS]EMD43535.1 Hypothetical protein EHI5A_245200 [Entamoeba histolytica KU27]EMS15485.1 hypothetical protein KM1_334120 [Entamoeba histolytica HM-3:IMSS]GAT98413.1 hypothetical protein CL6EHI_095450 [Entamoeba histolytica]|eukprot:XP_649222.1 hypothetical protein EHI_095450 [Entamoeba histolytica HM-1:IMSS]